MSSLLAIFVKVRGLSAVSIEVVDANGIRRFLCSRINEHSRAIWGKEGQNNMNPYEKLDHANETWDVKQTAAFLGCKPKTVYRLIWKGKIEGWMKVDGRYRFCPCKLKQWMEKNFNGKDFGGRARHQGLSSEPPEKENGGQDYPIRQAG